jgi:hypothetical protein
LGGYLTDNLIGLDICINIPIEIIATTHLENTLKEPKENR